MDGHEERRILIAPDSHSSVSRSVELQKRTARSASMSLPVSSARENQFIPLSGPLSSIQNMQNVFDPNQTIHRHRSRSRAIMPVDMSATDWAGGNPSRKNENLLRSGHLGTCSEPYCTSCPTMFNEKESQTKKYRASTAIDPKLGNPFLTDGRGWTRKSLAFMNSLIPPIMNPHAKIVQNWNKFFVISCLVAIFIDPLFFFLLSVLKDDKCVVFNWTLALVITVVRSVTDFFYFLHMLLQFRLAYVAPESRVVGAGDLVDEPKKVAAHYLRGFFPFDAFVVLPLPQVMIWVVLPEFVASPANYAKNLLRASILIQYIPRILRFLPLAVGHSASGFIFESAWANFVINLLMFVLAGHVVGSCWYLFGLQRVNQCLRNACALSNLSDCKGLIDCGRGDKKEPLSSLMLWQAEQNSTNCFNIASNFFQYGIYQQVVLLSTEQNVVKRYIYSLFWGFQQISTLAGNLVPSYFVWEVLFTMAIVGLGLLLFALLIGNMQNFLQALGRRRLEMQLRRRDVEQWMSHRRLPDSLKRQVRHAERFNWAATRGINEEELLQNMPEDLQREIKRHFFTFLKKVRIFTLMGEPTLDVVYGKLRQSLYISGSNILYQGGPVEKMVFIVRGKLESIGSDGNKTPLSEGDVCGEELLTWYLEHSSLNKDGVKIRFPGYRLFSDRTVRCLTNVEAFALRATDLEEVTDLFARFLRNPRVQGVIRYESPYWRLIAATRIQVAWRYRRKRLQRMQTQ
ncbi:hypothetical protein QJS04_geneDACA017502 [Acorus gramineus]|uniref:Cyclic nucleotide-binding domain-containing protein n=1 Tax=Acorus gramineus TaxID=55184 RepID=A0AAV9AHD1_ACOGR|nr:hypothetical protein QJS04_geneDACA017502 [Acorus gramineus]